MNIFELLKQLKNIEPDPAFSASSKRAIFAQVNHKEGIGIRNTIFRIIEAGAAVALTGLFILVLTGSFAGSKLAPVRLSAIDPQGIRAEAQAIDIQIQLANLTYQNNGASAASTASTARPAPALISRKSAPAQSGNATSSPTSTLTIDDALQALSQ